MLLTVRLPSVQCWKKQVTSNLGDFRHILTNLRMKLSKSENYPSQYIVKHNRNIQLQKKIFYIITIVQDKGELNFFKIWISTLSTIIPLKVFHPGLSCDILSYIIFTDPDAGLDLLVPAVVTQESHQGIRPHALTGVDNGISGLEVHLGLPQPGGVLGAGLEGNGWIFIPKIFDPSLQVLPGDQVSLVEDHDHPLAPLPQLPAAPPPCT